MTKRLFQERISWNSRFFIFVIANQKCKFKNANQKMSQSANQKMQIAN